ncbi:hypothetical protein KIN20_038197 [Parelaphostrongylus tenuis]|uniref:Uncharacterized protein n=1 Tax=Parelaphostrongylus tenuis TaxID=148309 RepID=A0AAD5REV1_PARTN|nr:hypothetical protein KIN20_038197 [Parelaphostrongylus tenuis]
MGNLVSTSGIEPATVSKASLDRPCSNHRQDSAASHRSLPILSNLISKRSSCDGLTKAERLRLVDRAIRSESAALECEEKVKGLEREIRKLELRNHDLSTEVCWLRQQCTIACSEVPSGSTTSTLASKCSDACQMEGKLMRDTMEKQNADLSSLRMKVEQMAAVDMRKDIRISELVKELDTAKARISTLEDLCRSKIGSAMSRTSSSFTEIEERETRNTNSEARDELQQKHHSNDTIEEADGKDLLIASKNSTHRDTASTPRPSLRNIFVMDKDHRIDGKVRPSTAFDSPSTKHSILERGESFPCIEGDASTTRDPFNIQIKRAF